MNAFIFVIGLIVIEEICYFFYHFFKKQQIMHTKYQQYQNIEGSHLTHDQISFIKQETIKDTTFVVDDITWSDLAMDTLYQKMNYCLSTAGDQALYGMLRTPLQDEKAIAKRYKIIEKLQQDETLCASLSSPFMQIDNTERSSIYAIYDMDIPFSKWKYLIFCVLSLWMVILCVLIPFYPSLLEAVFFLGCWNCFLAFRLHKKLSYAYLSALQLYQYAKTVKQLHATKLSHEITSFFKWEESSQKLQKIQRSFFVDFYSGDGVLLLFAANAFLFGPISFYRLQNRLFQLQKEIKEAVSICGNVDACLSVACYLQHRDFHKVNFAHEKSYLAKNMRHPLLEQAVPNDVNLYQNLLVSGSNASGKSTYLKMIAMNTILAQSFGYANADSYQASLFYVYTSMSLHDFIKDNDSYFMAEIKSIKRILDVAEEKPVLCMIDEILNGTNTKERIAASTEILYTFTQSSSICLSATHDMELPHILQNYYHNIHFREDYVNDAMQFHYKMQEGPANSQNALALLAKLGFDEATVQEARSQIDHFQKTNTWFIWKDEVSHHV